ncbi:dihydrolipoyl dehydrogenase [Halanaerobium praevalens]|uniref:Dihydrolipoyl dehydrogenase n=1 Tax=Halanaerobium praevalens (strain ATCC 33744 / DSM 2228 / GSL) TaxID=572479 RepID=E3DLS2_HALPG|nr:dihydrolipoyl dehydrogenase [Halanaerobium praevalens]ADO77269.1 dihydrolipoamide dehydrogenase [Halanaerobium praevalens DSM 2228]
MKIKLKADDLPKNIEKAKITMIKVEAGDQIELGQEILILEASKNTINLKSEFAGKIEKVLVETGTEIEVGTELFLIKAEAQKSKKATAAIVNKTEKKRDLAIIGAGPGGYVAALKAAKNGAQVTLIEKNSLGGTCLNWGCVPTKALVRSAEVYDELKNAAEFGCKAENISFDWKEIIGRKDKIVAQLSQGIKSLLDKENVEFIKGKAELIDQNTVKVVQTAEEITIKTENIILATGSKPNKLAIVDKKAESLVLDSKALLELNELPEEIVIIGGGVIGLEFAFILARLDVKVTVIEYLAEILNFLDPDLISEITEAALEAGIKIQTKAEAKSIKKTLANRALVEFEAEGEKKYISADKVLMAAGRKADFGGLDLAALGLKTEKSKAGLGIKVNQKMQTTVNNIYAIGDMTAKTQLAHAASEQGIVAVKNILGQKAKMDYQAIPKAIFTEPEIAVVGLSEKEAKAQALDFKVGKFPIKANSKALTLAKKRGFVKLITAVESDLVLGASIIGPHATDLIAELTLAINNKLKVEEIIETIHAHPTSAESIHEAALAVRDEGSLHF